MIIKNFWVKIESLHERVKHYYCWNYLHNNERLAGTVSNSIRFLVWEMYQMSHQIGRNLSEPVR